MSISTRVTEIKKALGIYRKRDKFTAEWALKAMDDLRRTEGMEWFTIATIAQGIRWADATARTDGMMSMALRRMSATEVIGLVVKAESDGVTVEGDMSRWLWANRELLVK